MKNVLITGSSKGIGASIAKKLATAGYNVFLTGRNTKNLSELSEIIGAKGYFSCDLLEESTLQDLINEAHQKLGNIDILINNAGEYIWSPIEKTQRENIERLLKLNLQIPYELCTLVSEEMKQNKWGRIINIGSISGAVGEANASLYSASKAGLIGMTKALALELAEYGITVNVINPGWVKTDLANECFESDELDEAETLGTIPQRRFIHPDEIASLIAYAVSEEAKGLTGQSLNLCAGLSLG